MFPYNKELNHSHQHNKPDLHRRYQHQILRGCVNDIEMSQFVFFVHLVQLQLAFGHVQKEEGVVVTVLEVIFFEN